jgi:copper resistance protein B
MPSHFLHATLVIALVATTFCVQADDVSPHVAPAAPAKAMPDMPYHDMAQMMTMNDAAQIGMVLVDRMEWRHAGAASAAWEANLWYGGDYNKLWFKTEGWHVRDRTEDARAELLWDRTVARWWSLQLGAREDFGSGPSRTWAAVGMQGLAPQWFTLQGTLYAGDAGRTAARFQAQYELLFTQRLILQPELEVNLYGKSDPERNIGSGFSDMELGLRLRYEVRREFAPYVGLTWNQAFGETADLRRAANERANELCAVAGVRVWF